MENETRMREDGQVLEEGKKMGNVEGNAAGDC